jgi:hypothetical protein
LGHLAFPTLRLYNPESHEWSMNISQPDWVREAVGCRRGRRTRGRFLDQEDCSGTNIRVRFEVPVLSLISCSVEQTSSTDGTKTRELILDVN